MIRRVFDVLQLVVLVGASALVSFWLADTRSPIEHAESGLLDTGPFRPGDTVWVKRTFCDRGLPGRAERALIDSEGHVYPMVQSATIVEHGCHVRSFAIVLPAGIAAGRYIYRVDVTYAVNPLKTKTVRNPDVEFVVVR